MQHYQARQFESRVKVMLIAFFNMTGVMHMEFLPQGQTINQQIYKGIVQYLMQSIQEKR